MSDFGQRFVIDNNTLSQLGRRRRASVFFRENVVIPEEVMHEAEGFPDFERLRDNMRPTNPRVLHWLLQIMATVPDDDTRLVNLYANKGNADPLVVAFALEGRERDGRQLFCPDWFVVTADEAVREKSQEFGLTVLSNSDLSAIIDEAIAGIEMKA